MSTRLFFNEVATRDGFQNEGQFVPTDDKVALVDALSLCGFVKIEVTSFTSPKHIPMLRDAEEVMGRIQRVAGVEYTVLVPNLRMPRSRSFAALSEVIRHVNGRVPINVSLSCAFGCPMEGDVPLAELLHWSQRFADLGVRGLTICDTTGMAHPGQVRACVEALQARLPKLQWTLHFHNTRGMGLANVLAAVQGGITRFDSALGGLGGCPYAPGASGNICTEDTLHMLQAMGYDTGVDLPRVLALARQLPTLVGHPVPGQVAQAGRIQDLHPAPAFIHDLMETPA